MLMTSSKQEKHLLFKSSFLTIKHYVSVKALCVSNLSATFQQDSIKDREAAAILKQTVLAVFHTQQSKDDATITVTPLSI